jgi:glycerol uptake facilitator protein
MGMTHFLGELLGTMILILLGDGVVAGVLLARSKSQNAGWIVITAGWAFAVMCGVFTAAAFGAPGHLNPAVTLGALSIGAIELDAAMRLVAGQFAGAFIGAILVWLHFLPHWPLTADPALKLAVFCTGPAIRHVPSNVISEVIGTFVLVFVAGAITQAVPAAGLGPYLVGGLVWGIGLSLGGTTGYAINPARDLGPRIAHAILPIAGKGDSDWAYAWIPVVGPIIGGVAGAMLFEDLRTM